MRLSKRTADWVRPDIMWMLSPSAERRCGAGWLATRGHGSFSHRRQRLSAQDFRVNHREIHND